MEIKAAEKVLNRVLKRITPTTERRKEILDLAEKVKSKIEKELDKAGLEARVRIEGSIAKDTWLTENPDIDIFVQFPVNFPKKEFKTTFLEIAKKATKNAKHVERYAEHPYLEAIINSAVINIVPCYKVKLGEWLSATDRTPYHTDYVKKHLTKELSNQVRLLKKFMQGIGVYGAEIKIGGFSGYLCELLILKYRGFLETLENFSNWKGKLVIDLENHFENQEDQLNMLFKEPLVVVDPVDKGRNVAAAVRKEHLYNFIAASRAFIKNPNVKFFYPPEIKPLSKKEVREKIRKRETLLLFLKFSHVETVPDILWGQLYKSQRALEKMFKQYGFNVMRSKAWSDEKTANIIFFEIEQGKLPQIKKHLGPPLDKRAECEKFLLKHVSSSETFSGPYIEGERWVVDTKRKYTDAVKLLSEKLKSDGRKVGIGRLIAESIDKGFEILVNEQIIGFYASNREFAKFLTRYLEGFPIWLRWALQ